MVYTPDRTVGDRTESDTSIVRSLLRAGSLGAAVLMAAGVLMMLVGGESALASRLTLSGLVALVLTPVLRVAVECWTFARRGEWLFTLISLLVLLALGAGMVIGVTH